MFVPRSSQFKLHIEAQMISDVLHSYDLLAESLDPADGSMHLALK
jgi:hypothetical protein